MPHEFQLLIALLVPFVVLMILRINAAMVFLSVCLGYVLVELVAKDANSLISFLAPDAGSLSQTTWQLGTFLTPVVLTSIIMIFSVKGHLKVMANALPAAAASVLIVLIAVPLCTPGLRHAIEGELLWTQLSRAQSLIVGTGALVSLIFLWTQRRSTKKSE